MKANREDMDKVVTYLLEKETITGAEMVAIIEGRDPALVEDAYASTHAREEGRALPGDIEPAARKVHMISQKIEAPEEGSTDGSAPAETPAETPEEAPAEASEEGVSRKIRSLDPIGPFQRAHILWARFLLPPQGDIPSPQAAAG